MKHFFITVKLDANGVDAPVEIMRTGSFNHARYGIFDITEETMDEVMANFVPDRIAVDFNHNSARDGTPEETRAAGWIQNLFKEENDDRLSLMAEVRWTDAAREFIGNEEFRFVSPEFTWAHTDPESGESRGAKLLAFALTNRPFLPGMSPVTLAQTSKALAPLMLSTDDKIEETLVMLASQSSISDTVRDVTTQFYRTYRDSEAVVYWVEDVRDDNVIVRRESNGGSDLFQIEFDRQEDADVQFQTPEEWTKVKRAFVPLDDSASNDAGLSSDEDGQTSTDGGDAMNEELLRKLLSIGNDDSIEEAIAALTAQAGKATDLETQMQELTVKVESLETEKKETEQTLADDAESVKLTEENEKLARENQVLTDELAAVSDRVAAVEADRNQEQGEERIALAIENRKILPSEVAISQVDGEDVVPAMRTLAFESPDVFDSVIASRAQLPLELTIEQGEGETDTTVTDPKTEYWHKVRTKARQLMADEPDKYQAYSLAQQTARADVEQEFPELATQAKKAS